MFGSIEGLGGRVPTPESVPLESFGGDGGTPPFVWADVEVPSKSAGMRAKFLHLFVDEVKNDAKQGMGGFGVYILVVLPKTLFFGMLFFTWVVGLTVPCDL